MAASLRAAATRILRPARFPGEGVLRLADATPQYRYKAALEEGSQRASQIKQMKEELYDLIAEDVANSVASKPDRPLLKRLCTQVEPRPNDPQWRKLTRNKKVLGYCVTTGFVVSSVLAVSGLTSRRPKVVNYGGYLVTTESLPMLQERLRKEAGYHVCCCCWGDAQAREDAQANGLKILFDGEARRHAATRCRNLRRSAAHQDS